MSDNNTNKTNKDQEETKTCNCSLTCCQLNDLYQKCNDKLKQRTTDVIKLQEQIKDLYNSRSVFENKTKKQLIIESANALIVVFNVLNNILQNNQITDILDIKDTAMFNACHIASKQISAMFSKLNIFIIEPKIGENYDPNFHNAISTVCKENIQNQTISYIVEPGFYYKKGESEHTLIKPAIVIINIHS